MVALQNQAGKKMAGSTTKSSTALMSKKDSVRAIKAEGELKALKSQQKAKTKRKNKKSRNSITAILAFVVTPLVSFFAGNIPLGTQGFMSGGTLRSRFSNGMNSMMISYTGFDLFGGFYGKGLIQGWAPIGLNWLIRKMGVNRRVPRNSPILL